jgi:3-oxo-5-alpha-steroid 4-dehydrogenase 3
VPALRSRFLNYGSRATVSGPKKNSVAERPSAINRLLDSLAGITVPHRYFTHFYLVSILCSVLWGVHLWRVCGWSPGNSSYPAVDVGIDTATIAQIQVAWLLMLLQGVRRFLESCTYTSSSKSSMWFGHWILGLVFYLTINVAIWIEGVSINTRVPSLNKIDREEQVPTWKLAVLTPAILTAHAFQHIYHAYLYRLRTQNATYQLPSHPLFPNILCPHYTCEVAIYLLLSFLATPNGRSVNWTLLSATVFVAVNLGVTADGTKAWYGQYFGAEKVSGRRRMIPGVW